MDVLAYLGPETMLPMTSVIAGVAGFVMMFGRKAVDLAARLLRPGRPAAGPSARPAPRARGHRPTSARPSASMARDESSNPSSMA